MDYKERAGHKDYIDAHIIVETPGQRGIILGKGGAALKTLGSAARADIEEFLGKQPRHKPWLFPICSALRLLIHYLLWSLLHCAHMLIFSFVCGSQAGREVYLDISVKVQGKWRKDEKAVLKYGY